jgi:hypothetical protein
MVYMQLLQLLNLSFQAIMWQQEAEFRSSLEGLAVYLSFLELGVTWSG